MRIVWGVLHLDLKPANVLIDENGIPHVADFGLARRMEQGLAADNNEVSGTPSYMAPEQAIAGAQKITPTTDIWGLGAVLYETGHWPASVSRRVGTGNPEARRRRYAIQPAPPGGKTAA